MRKTPAYQALSLSLFLLSACQVLPQHSDSRAETSSPGTAVTAHCEGSVQSPPAGIHPAGDPALLQLAVGEVGQGKLCTGQVFIARQAVLVYRVWDQSRPGSLYGSWWSFQKPSGSRQQYRLDNAICPQWSALDVLSVCQIKIGSKLVIGPGQSARCSEELTYPPSAVNQIYLPNNLQQNLLQVENCSAGIPWPAH